MKTFMLHVPYINVETSKIIGATEFCSSGQVSNSDDVTDFHINYEQIPTNSKQVFIVVDSIIKHLNG